MSNINDTKFRAMLELTGLDKKSLPDMELAFWNWITQEDNEEIKTSQTQANDCAALQIDSTSKGLLLPRMTTSQRNAISNPMQGLLIYNTTLGALNYYDGSTWDTLFVL